MFCNTPDTSHAICISQITLALSQHIEALVTPGVEQVPIALHAVLYHPKRHVPPCLEPSIVDHPTGPTHLVQQLHHRNLLDPDHLLPQVAPVELDLRRRSRVVAQLT